MTSASYENFGIFINAEVQIVYMRHVFGNSHLCKLPSDRRHATLAKIMVNLAKSLLTMERLSRS